jgi:ATP-dependent DNA helicase RecG
MKEAAEKALRRLGIELLRDLVFYKPSSYHISDVSSDFSKFRDGMLVQVDVNIDAIVQPKTRRAPTKIYTSNDSGTLALVFFNKIPPFIFTRLKEGVRVSVQGKVQFFDGNWQMNHPEFLFKKELQKPVEPIYPLTYGIINKQLYGYILSGITVLEAAIKARQSFGNVDTEESSYIKDLLEEIKLLHLVNAQPNAAYIEKAINFATKKLAAKELFANQVSLAQLKSREKLAPGRKFQIAENLKEQVLAKLGFALTDSQKSAIAEIELDQNSSSQMMRLLQGDVGSGKTLVALLTMINVAYDGAQSALMVPTDLLSIQHFNFFQKALEGTDIKSALLTGKTTARERKIIKEGLESGEIHILIGTHALFQNSVEFKDLGFVVIDEQHRFGVEQRLELISKASHPDVLVMTATPIPRSLTLTMFGDMSVSQIKTKPKNRLPIISGISSNEKKDQLIESLQKKLDSDEKIYWVCPLIDQNDKLLEDGQEGIFADVTARYQELEVAYPGQVGLLHGKMKAADKDEVMQKFKDGILRVLVSTTVIEVGIDVPDATLIIIENAEKFGLAQLHQLRGRVGRGELQSYCMLMYNPKFLSKTARKRLEIMRSSSDGFYIAEQDLILRGGGEILGTKQSGEPDFFFANLGQDLDILLQANKQSLETKFSEFINFQTKLFNRDRGSELAKSG